MDIEGSLDRYDHEILEILSKDGRLAVTELAQRIGLSKSPCQVRLRRLQAEGYILGFKAVLNPVKLEMEQVAFVEVKLTDTTEPALSAFNRAVQDITEVEQCHLIAGAFDYLIKIRTKDIRSFREVLGRAISTMPNVGSTSTQVSMQSVKDDEFFDG